MNITALKSAGQKVLTRGVLKARKHSPEILVGVGVVGFVTTIVLASKATLKLESTLQTAVERVEDVKAMREYQQDGVRIYDEKSIQRDMAWAYIRNVGSVAKLYLPTAAAGGLTLASFLSAHGIMKQRNLALIAAYNALEHYHNAYRERVGDELGEDRERDIRHAIVEEKVKDEESGKTKTIARIDKDAPSMYARFFEKGSTPLWEPTAVYNRSFLLAQQQYANDRLLTRGHVFLNEIYEALGFEHTREGAVVGWVLSKDGDNHIDFGIMDFENDRKRAFQNGDEASILLDFNVDGVIWDKI